MSETLPSWRDGAVRRPANTMRTIVSIALVALVSISVAFAADDLKALVRANLSAWQSRLPALRQVLPQPNTVFAIRFSPDSRRVLVVTSNDDDGVRCLRAS